MKNMSFRADREKENLQNFKKVIRDMLFLLRTSLQAETVSMHWINTSRDLLVLENYATNQKNVVFPDRVNRKEHYLGNYDSIKSVTRLETGVHIATEDLEHYSSPSSVQYIYLIPFIFNSETVAITSVETFEKSQLTELDEAGIAAFQKALSRLLQTYLEISDLVEKQTEWSDYEEIAGKLVKSRSPMELVVNVIEELQKFVGQNGGALLLARGMDDWHSVLYSEKAVYPPPVGLAVQEGSISYQALAGGEPLFSTHFNANPKRISGHEPLCNGASLAVPVMHNQRRQLLVLTYSENPLMFTEAIKHKINNLCRITGLKIEGMLPDLDVHENLFSTGMSSYTEELFSECLQRVQAHLNDQTQSMSTWVGMIAVGNIADLRTKYRLEDLTDLQMQILLKLKPQKFGYSGILGEYSDYVYTFILQSTDESAFTSWTQGIQDEFGEPVAFAEDASEPIALHIGYTLLQKGLDADGVMQKAKKAMNEAVKSQTFKIGV